MWRGHGDDVNSCHYNGTVMRIFTKRYHPPGTSPGSLTVAEDVGEDAFTIRLIDYTAAGYVENDDVSATDCRESLSRDTQTWVDVRGTVSADTLTELGELFGLHSLAMEDVVSTGQRGKMEAHSDHLFLIMSLPDITDDEIGITQVSLFLGKGFLITFNDAPSDLFEPLRHRLRQAIGRARTRKVDYLLYAVLDIIIDQGFPMLEDIGERIEGLEEEALARPRPDTLQQIHTLKRELLLLRRMLWPQREVVNALLRDEDDWITDETRVFLRDCYDHTIQIMDLIETCREMVAGILDVYLSNISYRMNDIMRVLTIIATIFIPLTFLVGLYGMNFSHPESPWAMPELHWYYGYPLLWLFMVALVAAMLWIFRRRKWL
jgi:magnesium transporter